MMTFYINGIRWKIRCVNFKSPLLNGAKGTTDNLLKTIFIADTLPRYLYFNVLVHEITHAMWYEVNGSETLDTEDLAIFVATYSKDILNVSEEMTKCRYH